MLLCILMSGQFKRQSDMILVVSFVAISNISVIFLLFAHSDIALVYTVRCPNY